MFISLSSVRFDECIMPNPIRYVLAKSAIPAIGHYSSNYGISGIITNNHKQSKVVMMESDCFIANQKLSCA
nr:MAG TPA: hypothetical protein [Caudoviricetes sp.]